MKQEKKPKDPIANDVPPVSIPAMPPPGPTWKREWRCGLRISMAIMAVHERKAIGWHADYAGIALRFGTTEQSLRNYYSRWKRGMVLLAMDADPADKVIDRRALHQKLQALVSRHTGLIAAQYEVCLYHAEDQSGPMGGRDKRKPKHSPKEAEKKEDAKVKNGAPPKFSEINSELRFLRRELGDLLHLADQIDRGYNSYLEDMQGQRHGQKPVQGTEVTPLPEPAKVGMMGASEHQNAIRLLDEMLPPLPVEVEVTPVPAAP